MKITKFLFIFTAALGILSCGGKNQDQNGQTQETVLAGTINVPCDNTIMGMLNQIKPKYDSAFKNAKVTLEPMSAREAMKALFAGSARCVVVARDYLRDEDSVMKAIGIPPHFRYKLAEDALVFFTKNDFPMDTISDAALKKLMADDKANFSDFYPAVKSNVTFATLNENSSLYGNLSLYFSKTNKVARNIVLTSTFDELRDYVLRTPNAIGVGYLSQLVYDDKCKMLKISWVDSTGKYFAPKIVHQSYLTMGEYPYKTKIFAYLFEQERKLPMGFSSFLGTDQVAQRVFLSAGIEPAYAKIVITKPE